MVETDAQLGRFTPRPKTDVQLIGQSAAMVALQQEIDRVARADAKVLITGESGVGKEVVARTIHFRGPRASEVFTPVNCAGIPRHSSNPSSSATSKGASRGLSRQARQARIRPQRDGVSRRNRRDDAAHAGLLLRFLETGEFQKVGADGAGGHVNVRVMAATNRNLGEMIGQGIFRKDLFYRLNVIHLNVPPLRERPDDIPALVNHFRSQFAAANRLPIAHLSPAAMKALADYSCLGNVRELENVLERVIVTASGNVIEVEQLPWEITAQDPIMLRPKRERRRTVTDNLYKRMLEHASRSGPQCTRDSSSAKSRAPTCGTWCGAASKRRAATTRSSPGSSTWNRASTSAS